MSVRVTRSRRASCWTSARTAQRSATRPRNASGPQRHPCRPGIPSL